MCAPKAPKVKATDIPPQRMAAVLPDGGDPVVRQGLKNQRQLARSAMVFTNQAGTLGLPSTAALGGA